MGRKAYLLWQRWYNLELFSPWSETLGQTLSKTNAKSLTDVKISCLNQWDLSGTVLPVKQINYQKLSVTASMIAFFQGSSPQFHTDPLSSTHRLHTRTTPFQHPKSLSSTPMSLSSIPKTPQFHLPLSSTRKTPQLNTVCLRGVLNWGVFSLELRGVWNWVDFGVELRGRGGTEGLLVWNWGVFWTESFLVWY